MLECQDPTENLVLAYSLILIEAKTLPGVSWERIWASPVAPRVLRTAVGDTLLADMEKHHMERVADLTTAQHSVVAQLFLWIEGSLQGSHVAWCRFQKS